MRVSSIAILLMCSAANSESIADEGSHSWNDICECLVAEWPEMGQLRKRRVEVNGISFEVLSQARQCERASVDSLLFSWEYWDFKVIYAYPNPGYAAIAKGKVDEYCAVPGFEETLWASGGDDGVVLAFSDPLQKSKRAHVISISTGDASSACQWGNVIIRSLKPVNLLTNLKVLHIDIDRGFFVYENEFGERRTAAVGDVISRDGGKVMEIAEKSIQVGVSGISGFTIPGVTVTTDETEVEWEVHSLELQNE